MTHNRPLHDCTSEEDRVSWAIGHMGKGGRITDTGLWLGGVDYPMQLIAAIKTRLRTSGRVMSKAMERMFDAEGIEHEVLAWRLS
jgi:hypothetical protein